MQNPMDNYSQIKTIMYAFVKKKQKKKSSIPVYLMKSKFVDSEQKSVRHIFCQFLAL